VPFAAGPCAAGDTTAVQAGCKDDYRRRYRFFLYFCQQLRKEAVSAPKATAVLPASRGLPAGGGRCPEKA
jgi:hypothetical protein